VERGLNNEARMPQRDEEKPAKPLSQAERRELRRAEALRQNLRRRKFGLSPAPEKPGSSED